MSDAWVAYYHLRGKMLEMKFTREPKRHTRSHRQYTAATDT